MASNKHKAPLLPRKDLSGLKYGRLTVIAEAPAARSKDGASMRQWHVKCECGNSVVKHHRTLVSGSTKSCGCLRAELTAARSRSHGLLKRGHATPPEYLAWQNAKKRCFGVGTAVYQNYGGRGITMCERWAKSFSNFLADMGPRPSAAHSIDRIDNDGHYEPGNCRWALLTVQANNKRSSVVHDWHGERLTVTEISKRTGADEERLRHYANKAGWSCGDAVALILNTPKGYRTKGQRLKT